MKNDLTATENVSAFYPVNGRGEQLYDNLASYKNLVNSNPKQTWIKANEFSQGAKYVPIRIIESLLSKVFPFWEVVQVGEPKILGNSVVISVNLRVYNPILGDWVNYAGVGAVPIELEKGASPLDFNLIKPKALHKNVPAAMSYAVSNAAKKIGRIFGAHLNNDLNEKI